MKLHLPRLLASAVLAAVASAPVYSASIPEGYDPIELLVPNELLNPKNEYPMGVLLFDGKSYTYYRDDSTATKPFYSGPSLFFTSAPGQSSVVMAFSGGYTKAFSEVPNLTFADMRGLAFSAMESGVIYTGGQDTSFTISGITDEASGNDDVDFRNNSISGNCGGAIDADFARVCIENNGGVRFLGNAAKPESVSSGNQNQGSSSSGGVGAEVDHSYTINLFGYKLSFEFGFGFGFTYEYDDPQTPVVEQMDICGGAINLVNSTLLMNSNEAVTFKSNSAVDYGGAISASPGINSRIEICNNGQVLFKENKTSGHVQNDHVVGGGGGAIFLGMQGGLVMDGNIGDIIFSKNLAAAAGGAIYHGGQHLQNEGASLSWKNNTGNISFEGNVTGGTGGAIYMQAGGRLEVAHNTGVIRFDHNQAGVSGGAISAYNAFVTLNDNTEILFQDNLVFHQGVAPEDLDSFSSYYVGGAIYGTNIQIHNNGTVVFQRNAEIADDGSFRLRSLYVEGRSDLLEVSLSARSEQTIEFRDSIYTSSDLLLNYAYDNISQDGTIIFTGKNTVEDLQTVKQAWLGGNATIEVTDDEINNSRTSIVLGQTRLNGGSLRVENGAIFKSSGIYLNEGSKSTLRIHNATVGNIPAGGEFSTDTSIHVNGGTTLEILGHSTIEGGKLVFADGARWSFGLDQTHKEWMPNPAALTFDGLLNINGGLTLILDLADADMMQRYKLYEGTYAAYEQIRDVWTAGNITVVGMGEAKGASFDDLVWENGSLYYVNTMQWSNAQTTGEWGLDDKNWLNDRTFAHGMNVKFTDIGAGTVTLTEELSPGSVMVTNSKGHDYTFTTDGEDGKLTYETELVKRGDGTLSLDLANDYTGTTKLEEGTLNLHDDNALGGSTLSTAAGTTLGVGDNADVVLKGAEHVINGDVVVDNGASLEIASGSYMASSSTVNGTLIFSQHAVDPGTLAGSGTLVVTNGAAIEFREASDFTGSINVNNGGSLLLNLLDNVVSVGKIALQAGDLTLQGLDAANQLTMAGGSVLSMVAGEVAERVTKVVADKVLQFAEDAILSAMLSSMLDADGDDILNEAVGGKITGPGLTLDAGSTLSLDNCFILLNSGRAESSTVTLNVTLEDIEKIHLELSLEDMVTQDSEVLLFAGVDKVNFVYDDAIIGSNGTYECFANHYFSGNMVGENTKLVFKEGALFLTNLVPEPTSATLSLLALAGLAARRRRK